MAPFALTSHATHSGPAPEPQPASDPWLPVDNAEQQRYHQCVNREGDNHVFDALFNVPTPLDVGLTGIPSVHPGKEWRAQRCLVKCNHADSQQHCEGNEEYYCLVVESSHSQTSTQTAFDRRGEQDWGSAR